MPGATVAFNAGNASFMHGAYDRAIAQYDKALGFRPGWKEAEENKALAIARRDQMKVDDKDREAESADSYKPGETVFDQKGDDKSQDKAENGETWSEATLQATWLRRVKTTPADFLKGKFAGQAHTLRKSPQGHESRFDRCCPISCHHACRHGGGPCDSHHVAHA